MAFSKFESYFTNNTILYDVTRLKTDSSLFTDTTDSPKHWALFISRTHGWPVHVHRMHPVSANPEHGEMFNLRSRIFRFSSSKRLPSTHEESDLWQRRHTARDGDCVIRVGHLLASSKRVLTTQRLTATQVRWHSCHADVHAPKCIGDACLDHILMSSVAVLN